MVQTGAARRHDAGPREVAGRARLLVVALALLLPSLPAAALQKYRCTVIDGSTQMADTDLSRDYPMAFKSCRLSNGQREPAASRFDAAPAPAGGWPAPTSAANPLAAPARAYADALPTSAARQYRCILLDGSLQMADSDLSRRFPMAVKSCQPMEVGDEPILARSVDTPVNALAFVRRSSKLSQPVASMIHAACLQQGLDANVVSALVYVESRYNPAAQSPKGAMGLMQIMPATAARYGVHSRAALLDPQVNIDVGTRYLRDLHRMFAGRTDLVLAAYNAGEGAVARYGNRVPPYAETQSYVRQIMALSGGEQIQQASR